MPLLHAGKKIKQLMVPEQFDALKAKNVPMQEVDRDSRRVIVKHPDLANVAQ